MNVRVARRLVLIPGALVALAVAAVGLGPMGIGACAAPPPGWHRVTTLDDLRWLVSPLAIFFVGEYFALGARRRSVRVIGSVLVLLVVGAAAFFLLGFSMTCGTYAP
jgi:hypothetical protein